MQVIHYASLAKNQTNIELTPTNDPIIRTALSEYLVERYKKYRKYRIFEEFGVNNGSARIDFAVINGIMHGYEIKSDLDTLERLPEQAAAYNSIFNQVTLVVGKSHLRDAVNLVPDWWGIVLAKVNTAEEVTFYKIRNPEQNPIQNPAAIARLLWKDEAITLLEERHKAEGIRSKTREKVYERLANSLDEKTLELKVREALFFRPNWRLDQQLVLNDD
jgi:hypothetical protein